MPYWNKYPSRDRAFEHGKPVANLTSRGMGVAERHAASVRENAESVRLAALLPAEVETVATPPSNEGTKP